MLIDLDELLCVVVPCVKILDHSLSFKRYLPPAIMIAYEDIPERNNQSLHIAWGHKHSIFSIPDEL